MKLENEIIGIVWKFRHWADVEGVTLKSIADKLGMRNQLLNSMLNHDTANRFFLDYLLCLLFHFPKLRRELMIYLSDFSGGQYIENKTNKALKDDINALMGNISLIIINAMNSIDTGKRIDNSIQEVNKVITAFCELRHKLKVRKSHEE